MPSCFGYSQKSSWFSLHHFSWRAQKYPCHILKYQRNQLLLHSYMTLDTNLAMERCRLCVNWQHQGGEFFYHQGSVSVSKSAIFCNYNNCHCRRGVGEQGGKERRRKEYENERPMLSFSLVYFLAVHSHLIGTNTCQQFLFRSASLGT